MKNHTAEQQAASNFDSKNGVDTNDALNILRKAAGII
jgi:hypothetical protein